MGALRGCLPRTGCGQPGRAFDTWHKQLVGIDERGVTSQLLQKVRANPNSVLTRWRWTTPPYQGLLVASNEHAVAFAGFGHRHRRWRCTDVGHARAVAHEPRGGRRRLRIWCTPRTRPRARMCPATRVGNPQAARRGSAHARHITLKWRVSTLRASRAARRSTSNTIDPWSATA